MSATTSGSSFDADPGHTARQAGLRHVSDDQPGMTRLRAGKGFRYRDREGDPIRDADTLARIAALAVPPAWTQVWICHCANGHLQATGRDARGRKQYRYHREWQRMRGAGKFDRIIEFGAALPRLRRLLRMDLAEPGFGRDKVLAIVVALLADTLVRIGNDRYARSNRSFGLTTLRNRHIAFLRGGRARLRFRGKGGQEHEIELDDARLAKLVKRCQQLPGQALFQYRNDHGDIQPVDSGAVNDYLHRTVGSDFSAKDFRTWGGTLMAFRELARTPLPDAGQSGQPSERALAQAANLVISQVAQELGNTPAVCRKSYIDPVLFEGWRDGRLQPAAANARGARQWERAALGFLKREHRRARAQGPL